MELVTTRGAGKDELGVVNTREVQGTCGLHLAHSETERPRVDGEIVENVVWEIGAVHLRDDIVVVHVRGVFEEGRTVDVERGSVEVVLLPPCATSGVTRDDVERLDWVVKVCEINLSVSVRCQLVLGLCDEKFMLIVCKVLSFLCIEVDVVTIYLGGISRDVSIATLDTDLDVVVLEGNERERLGPVFAEEERNHVVVTGVVLLANIGGHSERSLGGGVAHERVVYTLDVEGIELRHLLTTDPELEFGGIRCTTGEETIVVGHHIRDVRGLDPDVAHEITLRANRNGDLVVGSEGTNVIHTFGLHGEVCVTLVVLTEEADLGITRDVDILSTHRHELN